MIDHFVPRRQYWVAGSWASSIPRDVQQVTGRGDCIISTDRSRGNTSCHRTQTDPGGTTGRGSAIQLSLPTGADLLANTANGNASPDQGGISLCGYQRGYHKDALANEGACALDFQGDLETCGQNIGAPEGTSGKVKRGQAGTKKFPEILAGRKGTTVQGSRGRHRSSPGGEPKVGGVEAYR